MQDIEELCKRVIIIDSGRIFFDGPLNAIIDRFAPHKIVGLSFAGGAECDFAALCLMKGFREDGWVLAGGEDAGDFQVEDAELGGNTHADMNPSTTAALRAVTSVTPDASPRRPARA